MVKLTKHDKKEIAKLANMLPAIPIADTKIVSGHEIMTNESLAKYRKPDINPLSNYKLRTGGAIVAVNHKRRIEKAFYQGGMDAVKQYVDQFKSVDNNIAEKND